MKYCLLLLTIIHDLQMHFKWSWSKMYVTYVHMYGICSVIRCISIQLMSKLSLMWSQHNMCGYKFYSFFLSPNHAHYTCSLNLHKSQSQCYNCVCILSIFGNHQSLVIILYIFFLMEPILMLCKCIK